MSLLYMLNDEEMKVRKDEIGEIMTRVNNVLYDLAGLKLCIVAASYEELLNGNKPDGDILLEEILWKNMTIDEKVLKFSEYLNKIEAVDNDMVVVDPYIFPKKYDSDYVELITRILKVINFKTLKIVTSKYFFNNDVFEKVKTNLNMKHGQSIEIRYSDDFHDRFWISKAKKGFVIGTSLNGVGNKICLIDTLDESDVNELVESLNSNLALAF